MRGEYSTRQKRVMMSFLRQHDLEPYSVDDLVFEMQEQGEKIGRSTAYRYLEQLAEQGSVRKYQNARGITQYQHVANSSACDGHFHMMCKCCGRLMHVDCELMRSFAEHIFTDHGFRLDPRETVMMGVCARCSNVQEGENHGADHACECHHRL